MPVREFQARGRRARAPGSAIVDTSIECDHERFSGFLKISLEKLLLALRDDCSLLDNPEGLVESRTEGANILSPPVKTTRSTLYPEGFRAENFLRVIETEAVWATL
jgi:hypothetical protein